MKASTPFFTSEEDVLTCKILRSLFLDIPNNLISFLFECISIHSNFFFYLYSCKIGSPLSKYYNYRQNILLSFFFP